MFLTRDEHIKEKQLLRNFIRFPNGMYITPERPEHVLPKKALADQTRKDTGALSMELLTNHTQMRYVDHSFDNIRRFKRYRHFQHLQYDQRLVAMSFSMTFLLASLFVLCCVIVSLCYIYCVVYCYISILYYSTYCTLFYGTP
ncbi:unnamed protein product [Nippostrongylus brasiliensis]|uniref:ATP synthase subunit s-like protein (inferred by orthology to a human protein) n=1 Tax=Nippostrongylus brasiliensis TaxID=27835 RepID=A0A0N4XRH9_NIPBR|nr:unnamed protein product [Nippostrongylus brasiliensis]